MTTEFYYTRMVNRPEVWALVIDKENNLFELQAKANPEAQYRFLAMPTFLQVLEGCIGFKQLNIDSCV